MSELKKVFEWWQNLTGLELEYAYYSEQHYRDVNGYIWIPHEESYNMEKEVFEKAKKKDAKVKGCFVDKPEYHKDHSMLIVQKALIAYYTKKIPVETTIHECKDIYDFCKMVKAKGCKFVAEYYDKELKLHRKKQGKVVRYYIRKSKGHYQNVKLMKYLPPLKKETYTEIYKKTIPDQMDIFDIPEVQDCKVIKDRVQNVEASSYVEIFNKFEEKPFDEYCIDYDYYINECNKIIKAMK